jgi:vancomycin resistance protein YoaR
MPDLPDADRPDINPSAGDPELASLVALVRGEEPPDVADTSPTAEFDVEAMPVTPVADEQPAARPRRRRSLALRFGLAFAFGFLLMAGIGVGALYAWGQQYEGRVLPGVHVGNLDLGGLTRDEAEAQIATAYGALATGEVSLTGPDGHSATISYADVGRGPATAALLDAVFAAGRQGDTLTNLITGPRTALHGVTLDSAVVYDREKLATAITSLAATIDETPTDASITAVGGTFSVSPAKEGRAVDQAALLTALDAQLGALGAPQSIAMDVPVATLPPAIPTDSAEAARASAQAMAADIVVTRGEDSWTIPAASIAPLISIPPAVDGVITPVFDEAGLDPILETLAKDVNRKAKDAGLKLVGAHIVATGTSHEGRTLETEAMKAALITEINARASGAVASPVAAVVKAIDPKLTKADAMAYAGKMKVISSYSVWYQHIINNHFGGNIEGPATKIHGTVVPAGTKFDFWKVVGNLRNVPGTGPGNAIEGGKITVTGAFGGGICTTSTTLFNAAFRAGMIPLARKNHNEYITRYPAGLDATVWIVGNTVQTMSFKNDTQYPILISRAISRSGGKYWLTFKIWSVPNGRTAKISNTVIQHGPQAKSTTVKDPTKPIGYSYLNNAPADGAKVWTTVTIYDHGKKYWSKRYFSNYPAVDGVRIIGTKPTS